jgi:hypothetical protein
LARHVPRGRPVRPELPILPTVQDAAAATAGENVPDTEPAAMGDCQHRPGGPSPPLQSRQLLRRHAGPVHQVGTVPSRPKSYRPCGHSSALRGGHHPIRMPSDGDLGQWDPIHRRNISHPPPGTWDRTPADTAIHAPGEPRGKDEQNPEDHGGPVLRGRPKEVGRPSSGANVRPQHLTPRVDKVHASTAELWPRTRGTQCSPPSDTRKCRRRSARRHRRRSTRRSVRRHRRRSVRRHRRRSVRRHRRRSVRRHRKVKWTRTGKRIRQYVRSEGTPRAWEP